MADMYAVSGETLTGIADAIRSKTGSDEQMTVASMASAIEGISGGGVKLPPFIHEIKGGTFSVDDMSDVEITSDGMLKLKYNMTNYPKFIAIWDNYFKQNTESYSFDIPNALVRFVMYLTSPTASAVNVKYHSGTMTYSNSQGSLSHSTNVTYTYKIAITPEHVNLQCGNYIQPGRTYEWVAFH